MKKILLIGIFALVFSAVVFAAAVTTGLGTYDSETGEATINLRPGWNIVPFGASEELPESCNVKAVWIWSPTAKRYMGGSPGDKAMPQSDGDILLADKENKYLYAQQYGAFAGGMWVYVGNECTLRKSFWTSASNDEIAQMKLAKGWNFASVSPWMNGKKISEFLGDCTLSKITAWDATMQRWGTGASSTDYMVEMAKKINDGEDEPLLEEMSGVVFLMKVPEECNLGTSGAIEPPALPE